MLHIYIYIYIYIYDINRLRVNRKAIAQRRTVFFSTCNEMLSQSSLVSAYWMRDIVPLEHSSWLACYCHAIPSAGMLRAVPGLLYAFVA